MNRCFFIGKICSEIKFDFILNSKNISIARFSVKLSNGSIVKVKGYNEVADYCYSNLKQDDIVKIESYINNKCEIILEYIKRIGIE